MNKSLITFIVLALLVTACNLPDNNGVTTQESPDAVYTHAAETMSAELTRVATLASSTIDIPTSTFTLAPTNTPIYTPTITPIPCLFVSYSDATIDVTIPDNTIMAPGQSFTKIWRLTNAGSCTWNPSYQLVFDHGDQLGVSNTYSQPLTSGTVAPGQTVDVSVNLVAPITPGTYTGYWRFRDPSNVLFGLGGSGTWIVKIIVVNSVTLTLAPVAAGVESGTIRIGGGPWPDFTVGESNADITQSVQAFLAYNISVIPSNATITEVKTDFSDYTTTGNPFGLGTLKGYATDFGPTLDPGDFTPGFPPGSAVDWSSTAALNIIEASANLKAAIQSKVGTSRFQLRLQFAGSNGDGVKDRITFINPSLFVTYTTP
jgi:hypothetical protein